MLYSWVFICYTYCMNCKRVPYLCCLVLMSCLFICCKFMLFMCHSLGLHILVVCIRSAQVRAYDNRA